jgi:hypothetical protein
LESVNSLKEASDRQQDLQDLGLQSHIAESLSALMTDQATGYVGIMAAAALKRIKNKAE